MKNLQLIRFLFLKDLRVELRKKESLVSMAFFGALILVMLNIATGVGKRLDIETGAGILWVAIIFSSVLGLGRVFAREKENGCISALLISPASPSNIYFAKTLVNFSLMVLAEIVLVPVFYVLFGDHIPGQLIYLVPVLLLVNLGFSVLGTLISAISAGTRRNDVLLPILLFPLLLPLTALAVKATTAIFASRPFTEVMNQLEPMAAFCAIFTTAGCLLFPYAVRED